MRRTTTLIATLALLGGAARAEDAGKLAAKLARIQMPKSQYEAMAQTVVAQMMPMVEQQARQTGKSVPPDLPGRLARAFTETIPYDEVMEKVAAVMKKHFTVAEIKAIIAFYESPAGKKLADNANVIGGEIMAGLSPLVMERMPKMLEKLAK